MQKNRGLKGVLMNGKIRILNQYDILICPGAVHKLSAIIDFKKYSNVFVITDETVNKYWFQKIARIFPKSCKKIILPPGEQSKTTENVQKIWQELLLSGCDRKALVINLGGGVIGDLGGFAASTYMRGVDFLQIPTTLTGQVDSAIGGKVGINFAGVKNLIGTFNQPVAVVCDIDFLSTLHSRELVAGFAEVIKHGLIADKNYFEFVTSKKPIDFNKQDLAEIVLNSIRIKSNIVNQDEKEEDSRKLLNYGHTVGHAIESLSLETPKPLHHGEAIAIGMLAESIMSNSLKIISSTQLQTIRQCLINAGLPISIKGIDVSKIISKMYSDKKNEKGKINFTLLHGIGNAIINQNVPDTLITQALKQITKP